MNSKILKTHLERRAVVYLRQSTPQQVESNRESTERQYALADRAQLLGWENSQIQILDGDLGKSGQTTTGREDFHASDGSCGSQVLWAQSSHSKPHDFPAPRRIGISS